MAIKVRPGHTKHEVLPSLEAMARTQLGVLDVLAAAGEERDDRPRQYALTLARWTRDESTSMELSLAVKALGPVGTFSPVPYGADVWSRMMWSAYALSLGRGLAFGTPTRAHEAMVRCGLDLARVLWTLGEERAAAASRADGMYTQHFTSIAGRAPKRPLGLVAAFTAITY